MKTTRQALAAACLATWLSLSTPAWAQLRTGQPSGFTGSVAAGVTENAEGARLYLDAVNARATDQREAAKAIEHLASIGVTRIAVLQTDDSFGADSAAGALIPWCVPFDRNRSG